MTRIFFRIVALVAFGALEAVAQPAAPPERNEVIAPRPDDLRLSAYFTVNAVQQAADRKNYREQSVRTLFRFGISRVFLETYRGGTTIAEQDLVKLRDFYRENGLETAAGIATVPGGDIGVHQVGPLGWFNWQNSKTQTDLDPIVRMSARVFDTFIVDDFLCTGDVSPESEAARGDQSWPDYRRDLMTGIAQSLFVEPARAENPDINMIIKYPQWYDLFHRFGYDVPRQSALFDHVWVGTESRGMNTQRFGFMPPYQSFVNYRWIADIARDNIAGAWFDYGDCDADDFLDQAYQTVLAGAPEITIFSYPQMLEDHPSHLPFKEQYTHLADLARVVRDHPVHGVAAYKPPNSEAGLDINIIDHIGMIGVPIVPVAHYPEGAKIVFLPTQAAADDEIATRVEQSLEQGATNVMTPGLLNAVPELANLAGLKPPLELNPGKAEFLRVDGAMVRITPALNLAAHLQTNGAETLLHAIRGTPEPFMTRCSVGNGEVYVLNTYTYTQADFDAVNEVLLAPQPLGLMAIPEKWANTIRSAFIGPIGYKMNAPVKVTMQPLGTAGVFLANYNDTPVRVSLTIPNELHTPINALTGKPIAVQNRASTSTIQPRDRIWIHDVNSRQT